MRSKTKFYLFCIEVRSLEPKKSTRFASQPTSLCYCLDSQVPKQLGKESNTASLMDKSKSPSFQRGCTDTVKSTYALKARSELHTELKD